MSTTQHTSQAGQPQAEHFDWLRLFNICFGPQGFVALAWWLGALHAEQIRQQHTSYPFLTIDGEPGSGKSTLIDFLWRLLGRQGYQGFDPRKASLAARARLFAEAVNLPVVLIESDHGGRTNQPFDWDELKTAYNGKALRSRGTNGQTFEPPFRGAVCTVRCEPHDYSPAIQARTIRLTIDRSAHNSFTKDAADVLERRPVEALTGFHRLAMAQEGTVIGLLNLRQELYEYRLGQHGVSHPRVIKNHAQLMGLVDALAALLPLTEDMRTSAHERLIECSLSCQQAAGPA